MIRVKSTEAAVPMAKAAETRDLDIDLPNIRPDQSAQPRESLHNDRIAEYAESMKAGDQFPPLTVFHDGEVYWLADGFHRFYAAQHAGRKHIRCYVRQGGLRDAILYSVGANAKHGLPRTDEDKRRAVVRLLADAEWGAWSDNDIRKQCKVSLSFVQKLRKETSYREVSEKVAPPPSVPEKVRARAAAIEAEGGNPRFYKNKHGNVAVMNVSGINAGRTLSDPEKQANVLRSAWEKASPEAKAIFAATPEAMEIKASEPETVEQPATPFRNICDELVGLWKEADAGVRQDFKAYITGSEFVAKFNLTEGNPAPGTGGSDVDRSAERASSAVEVGATNSPDGATRRLDDLGTVQDGLKMSTDGQPKTGLSTDCIERPIEVGVTAGETAFNSNPQPKTPGDADKAEAVPPPAVSANPFNNPRCQKPETCHLAQSRNECFDCTMAWAKRPKDEQIRLWAEAIQAARAA